MTLGELYDALKELEEVETLLARHLLRDNVEHLDKRRDELRAMQLKVFAGIVFQGEVRLS